jgi:ApaG protein
MQTISYLPIAVYQANESGSRYPLRLIDSLTNNKQSYTITTIPELTDSRESGSASKSDEVQSSMSGVSSKPIVSSSISISSPGSSNENETSTSTEETSFVPVSLSNHSDVTTNYIRVQATAYHIRTLQYSGATTLSEPALYQFGYHIEITNTHPTSTVVLMSREWVISQRNHDMNVQGTGVVGKQPVLPPLASFDYDSHVLIDKPVGKMSGKFHFRTLSPASTDDDNPSEQSLRDRIIAEAQPHSFAANMRGALGFPSKVIEALKEKDSAQPLPAEFDATIGEFILDLHSSSTNQRPH